jgi:hypothetical protein
MKMKKKKKEKKVDGSRSRLAAGWHQLGQTSIHLPLLGPSVSGLVPSPFFYII